MLQEVVWSTFNIKTRKTYTILWRDKSRAEQTQEHGDIYTFESLSYTLLSPKVLIEQFVKSVSLNCNMYSSHSSHGHIVKFVKMF